MKNCRHYKNVSNRKMHTSISMFYVIYINITIKSLKINRINKIFTKKLFKNKYILHVFRCNTEVIKIIIFALI